MSAGWWQWRDRPHDYGQGMAGYGRRVAEQTGAPLRWAMGNPDVARAFGDVGAMPTLLLFDPAGRRQASFLGAPPSLHAEVEAALEPLLN